MGYSPFFVSLGHSIFPCCCRKLGTFAQLLRLLRSLSVRRHSRSAQPMDKSSRLFSKSPLVLRESPQLFQTSRPLFHPPSAPISKSTAPRDGKRDIAASFSLKIKGSRAAQTRNPKRKPRNKIEFLFLSRKRLFVFTTSQRNKRAKERAYPKDCVPLGYHPRRHAPFGAERRAQRITISLS